MSCIPHNYIYIYPYPSLKINLKEKLGLPGSLNNTLYIRLNIYLSGDNPLPQVKTTQHVGSLLGND